MMQNKRVLSVLIAFLLALMLSSVSHTLAVEKPARQIALVYDDSGSMIFNSNNQYQESWYRAKYAMEVFAAMMNSDDSMTVFPMSFYSASAAEGLAPITVQGTQSAEERVQVLHEMNHNYLGTSFRSVVAACEFLQQAGAEAEKWLVVLTDGYFEDESPQDAEAYMREKAAQGGFKVIYMAIGSGAAALDSDLNAGVYGYQAATSKDILSTVTQVANQVFSRRELPASRITSDGGLLTLRLDVPMSQLILFVQGENVEVGDLWGGGSTDSWTAVTKTRVKYSDQLPPNYSDASHSSQVVIDRSLQGVLADFLPEQPLPAGEYQIEVANTQQVQVYYTPYVEVGVQLTDTQGSQWELQGDTSRLYSGSYTAEAYLINPLTGIKLESELVQLQGAQLQMENNGRQLELEGLEGGAQQVYLEPGTVSGSMTAELDQYQTITTAFEAKVEPALWNAELECRLPEAKDGYEYDATRLEEGEAVAITVWETDPDTGTRQLMEEGDWENASLTATTAGVTPIEFPLWQRPIYALYEFFFGRGEERMEWTVRPGSELSTYLVRPAAEQALSLGGEAQVALRLDSQGRTHNSTASQLVTVRIAPPPVGKIAADLAPILLAMAGLTVVVVLWVRKKRLPRGLVAELRVHQFGIGSFSGGDTIRRIPIKRKFSLFRPETAEVDASLAGVLRMEKLRLCAQSRTWKNRKRTFCIPNLLDVCADNSIHPLTLNGMRVTKGDEKKLRHVGCELKCKANRDGKTGHHDDCTLSFRLEKRAKRRPVRRHRRRR